MWKRFEVLDSAYMLNLNFSSNDLFELKLTNLTYIWEDAFSADTLEMNFTKLNPLIETTKEVIKEILTEIVNELPNIKISLKNIENDNTFVELILEKELQANPLHNAPNVIYKFVLQKQTEEKFKSDITIPLIRTIHLLEKQQNILVNLLRRKDRELEEYRLEKGEISRPDLKTENFTSDTLKQTDGTLFLNCFNEENFKLWQNINLEDKNIVLPSSHKMETTKRKRIIYNASTKMKKIL